MEVGVADEKKIFYLLNIFLIISLKVFAINLDMKDGNDLYKREKLTKEALKIL